MTRTVDSKTKPETTTERGLDQDDWEDLLEPTNREFVWRIMDNKIYDPGSK